MKVKKILKQTAKKDLESLKSERDQEVLDNLKSAVKYKRLTRRDEEGNALIGDLACIFKGTHLHKAVNRLAELEDKIERGEIFEFPCLPDDKVYAVTMGGCKGKDQDDCFNQNSDCRSCKYSNWIIQEGICESIELYKENINICLLNGDICRSDEVFKDKDQAEARLKEIQGN